MDKKKLRWAILGTGNIAKQFALGVKHSDHSVLSAVGSRSIESARNFAYSNQINSAHGDYDSLINDPNCDAVYISLPNTMHHEWTIKALNVGKHVLCEKPISVSLPEAEEMFEMAVKTGKVLIEAFMYRAHPQTIKAVELVQSGLIGKVNLIRSSFCYRVRKTDGNIRFNQQLAGGAMMDVGCYCLNFSRLFAGGEPVSLHAVAQKHESGVDVQTTVLAGFSNGVAAEFTVGMMTQADNTASICGDEGYLKIPVPWKPLPGDGQIIHAQSTPPKQDNPGTTPVVPQPKIYRINDPRPLYGIEADAFAQTVLDSKPPFVSPADSIGNMAAIEKILKQI